MKKFYLDHNNFGRVLFEKDEKDEIHLIDSKNNRYKLKKKFDSLVELKKWLNEPPIQKTYKKNLQYVCNPHRINYGLFINEYNNGKDVEDKTEKNGCYYCVIEKKLFDEKKTFEELDPKLQIFLSNPIINRREISHIPLEPILNDDDKVRMIKTYFHKKQLSLNLFGQPNKEDNDESTVNYNSEKGDSDTVFWSQKFNEEDDTVVEEDMKIKRTKIEIIEVPKKKEFEDTNKKYLELFEEINDGKNSIENFETAIEYMRKMFNIIESSDSTTLKLLNENFLEKLASGAQGTVYLSPPDKSGKVKYVIKKSVATIKKTALEVFTSKNKKERDINNRLFKNRIAAAYIYIDSTFVKEYSLEKLTVENFQIMDYASGITLNYFRPEEIEDVYIKSKGIEKIENKNKFIIHLEIFSKIFKKVFETTEAIHKLSEHHGDLNPSNYLVVINQDKGIDILVIDITIRSWTFNFNALKRQIDEKWFKGISLDQKEQRNIEMMLDLFEVDKKDEVQNILKESKEDPVKPSTELETQKIVKNLNDYLTGIWFFKSSKEELRNFVGVYKLQNYIQSNSQSRKEYEEKFGYNDLYFAARDTILFSYYFKYILEILSPVPFKDDMKKYIKLLTLRSPNNILASTLVSFSDIYRTTPNKDKFFQVLRNNVLNLDWSMNIDKKNLKGIVEKLYSIYFFEKEDYQKIWQKYGFKNETVKGEDYTWKTISLFFYL